MKNFIVIVLLVLPPVAVLGSPFFLFAFYCFSDKDYCLDTGRCMEGLEINTEYGKIKINKENCIKYNWKWDEERNWCDLNE